MADQQHPQIQKPRPPSFSESHIQLPRILSNQKPLLLSIPTQQPSSVEREDEMLGLPWEPPDLPSVTSRNSLVQSSPLSLNTPPNLNVNPRQPLVSFASLHIWVLRFTLHLLLISIFETLFFWKYVAPSEDTALTGLVNTYTAAAFGTCAFMTPTERNLTVALFNAIVNTTTTLQDAMTAATNRSAANDILYRNSWLYFGGLAALFGLLASTAHLRKLTLNWSSIIGENVALVTFLGLYEFMFFRTIAFQYRAVSPDELDGMIVTEFSTAC